MHVDGFWWYRWHPDAGIGISHSWERHISGEILRPGRCFVDAGSHVGRWTIRASPFYQTILAFEPDPVTNIVLRRNIARNHIQNVRVFKIALSNRNGTSLLFGYGPPACNSLRKSHVSGLHRDSGKTVVVRELDDFMEYLATPMVMKIDVEGEELAVLEGAAATVEKFRPTIIVEVHFSDEKERIIQELSIRGYGVNATYSDPANPAAITYLIARPK